MSRLCVLSALYAALLWTSCGADTVAPNKRQSTSKDVIIQMFEWDWDSIAAECTNFIGPAGYGYIQASPAQEHVTGTQWWTDYQPVSYILTSKRGDRAQYQSMIATCHAAGVKIIADTIWNHMTGESSGTGVAGSSFTQYNYPGIYESQDFHYCGLEPDNNIVNWDNTVEVYTCQLDGLADLATNATNVQSRLAGYGNDLLSLGVDGLRLDAAKDINPDDIAAIISQLDSTPYITQEVIWGAGQPVTPNLYTGNGDVMEFRYTSALQSAFSGGGISSLESFDNLGWVSGDQANVFIADHDTERSGASLNANSPSNTYTLAHLFMLAHPYGMPTVLSSYSGFTNYDQGAPNNGAGTCSATGGTNGWFCQHRWPAIAGMVGFHNMVNSPSEDANPLSLWVSPSSEQIAFARGSVGFVAINNEDTDWTAEFTSALPAGTYCDVVGGLPDGEDCAGAAYTVTSSGTFTATVAPRNAIGLHVGATGIANASAPTTVEVIFEETATTTFGENIFLVGSISQLGSWDTDNAIALSSASYPVWSLTLFLSADTEFQYKFIRKETNGSIVWESDPNRDDTTPGSGTQTIQTTWR